MSYVLVAHGTRKRQGVSLIGDLASPDEVAAALGLEGLLMAARDDAGADT